MEAPKLTAIEAMTICRVLSRIDQAADRLFRIGCDQDAHSMFRLLGSLEAQIFPYLRYDESNPLFDPQYQRCKDCGHYLSDHQNGRCTHEQTDGGYHTDTICTCLVWYGV